MPDIYAGSHDYLDILPPYVVNEFPIPNSAGISVESSIGFDWLDLAPGTLPDPSTLNIKLYINNNSAINIVINGVVQTGFDLSLVTILNGLHVIIDPDDYLDEASTYRITIDGADYYGNEMDTHEWTWYTSRLFLTNSKCFLVNTKLKSVLAQSSYFQSKIKETFAGSHGNISLNVEQTIDLTPTEQFEIRTVKSGRLDVRLNTQLLREVELGSGQITYNEERATKGSFQPPHYVIEDADGEVYGLDLTMSKHIFCTNYSGKNIIKFAMCDRNDESFFVFIHETRWPLPGYQPFAYSIAKVGKTDSNPISGLVGIKTADDVVKVSENRFLTVTRYYYSTPLYPNPPAIYFTILDDNLNIIYQSEAYHFLQYLEQNNLSPLTDKGYLDATLYSDGNGSVYCVVSYSYNFSITSSFKLYFMKSTDSGYNWEMVNAPGTNEHLTVNNPVQDEISGLEPRTTNYQEQRDPKLSYDDVNEYFILTYTTKDVYNKIGTGDTISGTAPNMTLTDSAGIFSINDNNKFITITGATTPSNNGTFPTNYNGPTQINYTNASGVAEGYTGAWTIDNNSVLRRTVTMFSKDFINWSRLNFPIYKSNIGTLSTAEYLQESSGLYRFKDKYWSIGRTYVEGDAGTSLKNSVCVFDHDNQIYGYRRGSFWNGIESISYPPSDSEFKGALITHFEAKVFDDILYIAANCHNGDGYTIHAIGVPTNIPDKTPYSHAYFGNHDAPNNKYGYTATITGTPTTIQTDYGFAIQLTTADTAYYTYSYLDKVFLRYNGFKFKLIVARSTNAGTYDSDIAQRVYVKIPTQDSLNHFYFTVRIGTNGIKVVNETTPTENLIHNQTLSYLEFIEILVVAVQRSNNTQMDIRMFVKDYNNQTFEDVWIESSGSNVFGITAGVSVGEFSFGLKSAPSAASEYNWKAIYMVNKDLLDDIDFTFNDGIIDYVAGNNDEALIPIPMQIENVVQQSIKGMNFRWYGTDAIKTDKWNFEVDSDFEAENIFNKAPSICYRSANTSIEQTITLQASDDDLGMYIFDTISFMHTNFRYVKIQCNDDGSTWSPATYEKIIDMALDTGTIAATSERTDEDLLIVRCTNKDWNPGELIGRYLMLERIYEPHNTTPALNNDYKNVAFKILDNGTDFILISTKGLLKDELNTDYPNHDYDNMRVVSSENFLIYDTKIAVITNDPELFKYLKISIAQSVSYSTAWGNNQPILPNERSWQIGEFDIGQRIHLTQNVDYPYDEEIDRRIKIQEESDGRIEVTNTGKEQRKFFLNYRILSNNDRDELKALYNSANESGEPFWYIPDLVNDPEKVYLVVFNKDFSESKMLPEYQDVKIILDEVV